MRSKGGSAQDRRRARRAAARKAVASPEAVVAAADEPEELSPERTALASVREAFLHNVKCSCGHSYSEHEGAGGTCSHEDGRGVCGCSAYSEAAIDESTQTSQELAAYEWTFERQGDTWEFLAGTSTVTTTGDVSEIVSTLTATDAGTAPSGKLTIRLEDIALTADASVDLADELAPREELPQRTPSPAAPVDEQPTRSDREGVGYHWVATLCPEAALTDDGRAFAPGGIDWRELPLSLMAMIETQEGHDGAQVSGRIDRIWREGNLVKGEGVFDSGEFGTDIARMVDDRTLRGVSVDIAVHEFEVGPRSDWFDDEGNWAPKDKGEEAAEQDMLELLFGGPEEETIFVVTRGTIGAATVCPFQAFADATIEIAASLVAAASPAIWTLTMQSEFTITEKQPVAEATEGLTAGAAGFAPLKPPADWFADPQFDGPTAMHVTDDGRVYGHAALWGTCHIGIPGVCTEAPESATNYAYFLLKEVECDGGERIPCGTVTLEAPHADRRLNRADATAHYDNTGTAAVDVAVGEDEYGIWFAGALRPDVTEEQARDLRGATLSGDWRNVDGNLEMVALLAVNVPGFPVPRARALVAAAEDGNEVLTLVAAGINVSALLTDEDREKFEALATRADPRFAALAARAHAIEA